MNRESIHLALDANEADKVAHVLMAALHQPNMMLDSERATATRAANLLFDQLGYGVRTTANGERIDPPLTHRRRVKAGNSAAVPRS